MKTEGGTIDRFEHGGYRIRLTLCRGAYCIEAENLNVKKKRVRKRWNLKTKDLGEAKDEFSSHRRTLRETGRLDVLFESNLNEFIERFLRWSKTNSKSPKTYRYHVTSMKLFREFIAVKKIDKLNPAVYDSFKEYLLARGNAPRTVDVRLEVVRRMISVLEELEVIPTGAFAKPKLIKGKRAKAPKFWDERETQIILGHAKTSCLYDMIVFGLNTGLRLNELVHLRWEDVNFTGGFILVQEYEIQHGGETYSFMPKDRELRRVQLNSDAMTVLSKLRPRSQYSPFVFPNRFGKPRKNGLYRNLYVITEKAGLKDKGAWHTLRRTFAVTLLNKGANIEAIRQLLGHANITTTMRYLNVTAQHLDDTVNLLDFGGADVNGKVLPFKKMA